MRLFSPFISPEQEHRLAVLNGLFHAESFHARFDRSVQSGAKSNKSVADTTAGGFGSQASQIGSSLIPGLERQANNPTGFTPMQKNAMLVSGAESAGGTEAGGRGAAMLQSLRTKNPSGFASALDESARIKGRQLSQNALGVETADARQAQANQARAQQQLQGLYGTDTSNQLRAMGLSDEALRTQLEAGKSGWLQNVEGGIDTLTGAAKAFKPGGF